MENQASEHSRLIKGITLDKQVYYAGEILTGAVHVSCAQAQPYRKLILGFRGSESTKWTEHHGGEKHKFKYNHHNYSYRDPKYKINQTNQKETFKEQFSLAEFSSGLSVSQFSFPFSLLLPASLPASYMMDEQNYIRYVLIAYFSGENNTVSQTYAKPLNIRQPKRIEEASLKAQDNSESAFCHCCCTSGPTDLTLTSNAIMVDSFKPFVVKGSIDNRRGRSTIDNYKLVLKQVTKRISATGAEMGYATNQIVLHDFQRSIPKGKLEQIEQEVQLPVNFKGYTAIGTIIYRAYFIQLIASTSSFLCQSNPSVKLPILFNLDDDSPYEEENIEDFSNWLSTVSPTKRLTFSKPYIYSPLSGIDVRNQRSSTANEHFSSERRWQ